jgi:DNA primase
MLCDSIAQCKSRLPMPKLFSVFGLPEARRSMRSPFREDRAPSFSVFQVGELWFYKDHATGESGDEISLIQRHTGCAKDDAITSYHELAGVPMPRNKKKQSSSLGKIVKVYDYRDADRRVIHQTVRYEPKRFLQRRPAVKGMHAGNKIAKCDPEGNWWLWTLAGIEPVLYRLPELLTADQSLPVIICEGEKDCDALAATGAITTTAPMGAGKWRQSYSATLKDRDVIIAADRDPIGSTEAGQNHALLVAQMLNDHAKSVRLLDWSKLWPEAAGDPIRKLDISLWLESLKQKLENL